MAQPQQHNIIKSALDIFSFLVLAMVQSLYSILQLILPSFYEPVKSISGDVVLVTGGGSGLGRLLALKLARLRATVVVWDINEEGLEETVRIVQKEGGKIFGFKCDLTNRQEIYEIADRTRRQVGDVTILINNAGMVSGYLLLETPDHLIQRTFEVNTISHFWVTTKAFLPKMIENKRGHIVTIASLGGHCGVKKLVDYCSSKFAAVGFDESLRVELEALGVKGVKTTVVCPFFIQSTGMFDDVHSRFILRLTPEYVSDRVILGILREDIYVFLPKWIRYAVWMKWVFPWSIYSLVSRNLVPDASPSS